MSRGLSLALVLVGGLAGAGSAQAQVGSVPYKVAMSGQRTKIASFYSLLPDCRSMGEPFLRVIRPPMHGELGTGPARDYPSFPTTNTHSSCNSRRVPVTNLYYTATPGFRGVEAVSVAVEYPSNTARNFFYAIAVH